jgi:hypothetical protein
MTWPELIREGRIFDSYKIETHSRWFFENIYSSPKYLFPTGLSVCQSAIFSCLRLCRRLITSIWLRYKSSPHPRFILCRLFFWNVELLNQIPRLLRGWQLILKELKFNVNRFWEFTERKIILLNNKGMSRWSQSSEKKVRKESSIVLPLICLYVCMSNWLIDWLID